MKNSARLADFILSHMETIVADWEAFARSLLPASSEMDTLALRDHAEQILRAIAADLSTAQSSLQQADKSKGLAPPLNASETAAQTPRSALRVADHARPECHCEGTRELELPLLHVCSAPSSCTKHDWRIFGF